MKVIKKKLLFLIILLIMFGINPIVNAKNLYTELKENSTLDNIQSRYVSSLGIDFSETSSDTNGKGLYILGSTSSDNFPIIYYRGNISNNYVIYRGFCWEIIRTTTTGGIKIMYAGQPNNNTCNNTGADLTIGKSSYNNSNEAPKYGWTYKEAGEEKDSLAKTYLDNWYQRNMTNYTRELEDTIWCNDRRINNGVFNSRTRLEEGKPTLSCENEDSYTVSTNKGNGKLIYPTAIINADELTYAGEVLKKTQVDTFVNIAYSYWAMTPYVVTKNMYPNSKGMLNMYTFTYNAGIRPMISLRNTANIISGDGTNNNPYIVDVEKQYTITTDEYSHSDIDESEKNKRISFTVDERTGFKLLDVKVTDTDNNDLGLTINNSNGTYSFIMPEKDVKIKTNYRIVKESYKVETDQEEITIDEKMIEEDQLASFKVEIPHGYKLLSIKLYNDINEELNINLEENNGVYTFTMPGENVIIKIELEELPKYEVTGEDIEINKSEYYKDDIVEFKVKTKTDKEISKVTLYNENDEILTISLNNKGNNNYSFTMPDENIKVVVEYKNKSVEILTNPFTKTMDSE